MEMWLGDRLAQFEELKERDTPKLVFELQLSI